MRSLVFNKASLISILVLVIFLLSTELVFAFDLVTGITNLIWKFSIFIHKVAHNILGLCMSAFQLVLEVTIELLHKAINASASKNLWEFMRDLGNLIITGFFLYVAVRSALENSVSGSGVSSGTIKKILLLIVAALLINFSGYFVLFLIDISNLVIGYLWVSMEGFVKILEGIAFIETESQLNADDLGANIDPGSSNEETDALEIGYIYLFFINIIAATVKVILGVLILIGSLQFISRMIDIFLVFITSPLGILGYFSVVSSGAQVFTKFFNWWRGALMNAIFFPIAYLFSLLILLKMYDALGVNTIDSGGTQFGSISLTLIASFVLIFAFYKITGLKDKIGEAFGRGPSIYEKKAFDFAKKGWGVASKPYISAFRERAGFRREQLYDAMRERTGYTGEDVKHAAKRVVTLGLEPSADKKS